MLSLDVEPPRHPGHRTLWQKAGLLAFDALSSAVSEFNPTHVVHLAARTDLEGSDLHDYRTNTEGTRNLLLALEALDPPPRLLVASTRMVCPIGYQPQHDEDYRPPNLYGESKVETERLVRQSGYRGDWLIVRPTSIWGPWFGVPYRDFFLSVAHGRYRHPAGVHVRKSFGYVENTVHQLIGLLYAERSIVQGRLFYLADYEPIEVEDWARRIQAATRGPPVRAVPLRALRLLAALGDVLKAAGWTRVPLTRFRLSNLLTEMVHDLGPVREIVPALPVSIDTGVERTADWLRDSGALHTGPSQR